MEPAEPGIMVFHPGEFIADELIARKLPVSVLVTKSWKMKRKSGGDGSIIQLLRGRIRINHAMASHLRKMWGVDTEFWFRHQMMWDSYPERREKPPWPRQFIGE